MPQHAHAHTCMHLAAHTRTLHLSHALSHPPNPTFFHTPASPALCDRHGRQVLGAVRQTQGLAAYAGPGAFNDPDMLVVGLEGMYPYGIVQDCPEHVAGCTPGMYISRERCGWRAGGGWAGDLGNRQSVPTCGSSRQPLVCGVARPWRTCGVKQALRTLLMGIWAGTHTAASTSCCRRSPHSRVADGPAPS